MNKVATKVTISWDFESSAVLNQEQIQAIRLDPALSHRINASGLLVLSEQSARTQARNLEQGVKRLHELVQRALRPKKKRRLTSVPRAKKEARLKSKKFQSKKKQFRRGSFD